MPPALPRRLLITGAAGFLGAAVARAASEEGAEVHGVLREGSDLRRLEGLEVTRHRADVRSPGDLAEVLRRVRPEAVVHAAVVRPGAGRSPDDVLATNVTGTHNLLSACLAAGVGRVVHLGSATEYGPRDEPRREDHPLRPTTFYGVTKASATLLALQAAREGALEVVVLRPFYVYGGGEPRARLIPAALRAARDRRPLDLTGPGLCRDYVHVDDAVAACRAALGTPGVSGRVYNVGTGVDTSNEDLVARLRDLVDDELEVRAARFPARETDTRCGAADPARAREELGFRAHRDLDAGLRQSLQWWAAHPEELGDG